MRFLYYFILGSRIKTWPASLVPLIMSSALAFKQGFFDKSLFYFSALSILFLQIAVNLFNDALDGRQGLDDSHRRGPLRLVGSGALSFSQVRFMAFFSCFLAVLFAIPLVIQGGILILLAGMVSLCFTYFYTGSPYSLLKLGLSEMAVVLFFGFFIVFGVYYLQALTINSSLIYLSLQCGLWALSLLLINHLRDEEEDKKRGRRHIVTLYGRTHSLFLLIMGQAFIYLLCFYWLGLGFKSGAFSFFVLPLSVWLIYLICKNPPSQKYNFYLAFCSLCYILFGCAWTAGLLF
ncbi:MAG: 1,4-dihydroxy-2-naphthoate octaprenyltransferase [Oligoflexia bacterium]|nr:1,4-dihydroxy-2-naphthoate octaprenyltransferase [Oligoflexia bacterium]